MSERAQQASRCNMEKCVARAQWQSQTKEIMSEKCQFQITEDLSSQKKPLEYTLNGPKIGERI